MKIGCFSLPSTTDSFSKTLECSKMAPNTSLSTQDKSNVWYRNFMLYLTRNLKQHSSPSLQPLNDSGIPGSEILGYHQSFPDSLVQYSPLQGLLFSSSNFIEKVYKSELSNEPVVTLARSLFTEIPGREIVPTHLDKNPAAHLSAECLADIFVTFESVIAENGRLPANEMKEHLFSKLYALISQHKDYLAATQPLVDKYQHAHDEQEMLSEKIRVSDKLVVRTKTIESELKSLKNQITRLSKDENFRDSTKLTGLMERRDVLQKEWNDNRCLLVTSTQKKSVAHRLKQAEINIGGNPENLTTALKKFCWNLSECFVAHNWQMQKVPGVPDFATNILLLVYFWRKFNSETELSKYVEEIRSHFGDDNHPSLSKNSCFGSANLKEKLETDVARLFDRNASYRPEVLKFSYITWAEYSPFPDCGENALRNLLNQIFFNPESREFDGNLLKQLKESAFPNMRPELIEFYTRNSKTSLASSPEVAKEWLSVVSDLNAGKNKDSEVLVKYRISNKMNLASPLSNMVKAIGALFGIECYDPEIVKKVVEQVNILRGTSIESVLNIHSDGFGAIEIKDGEHQYRLTSHRPVHYSFTLLNEGKNDAVKDSSLRLAKFAKSPPKFPGDKLTKIGVASLFENKV